MTAFNSGKFGRFKIIVSNEKGEETTIGIEGITLKDAKEKAIKKAKREKRIKGELTARGVSEKRPVNLTLLKTQGGLQ